MPQACSSRLRNRPEPRPRRRRWLRSRPCSGTRTRDFLPFSNLATTRAYATRRSAVQTSPSPSPGPVFRNDPRGALLLRRRWMPILPGVKAVRISTARRVASRALRLRFSRERPPTGLLGCPGRGGVQAARNLARNSDHCSKGYVCLDDGAGVSADVFVRPKAGILVTVGNVPPTEYRNVTVTSSRSHQKVVGAAIRTLRSRAG